MARPCLGGEVAPVGISVLVVDDNVGDGAQSLALEGADHRFQLVGGAESTLLVEPPDVGISHLIREAVAVSALRNPYEVEVLCQRVGLRCEVCPLRVLIAVPVERLEHHAAIVGWPTRK